MARNNISISQAIAEKLATRHRVVPEEIYQCFDNRNGAFLEDTREEHQTDPPTQWFVAETNRCRRLKIVFVQRNGKNGVSIHIKTAYDANSEEIRIYSKYA